MNLTCHTCIHSSLKAARGVPSGNCRGGDQQWLSSKYVAIDAWGVIWERHGGITSLGQVIGSPIETWDDLSSFEVPDPRISARYKLLTSIGKVFGRGKYKIGSLGNFFYERYHFLRGWQNANRDLVKGPKQVHELLEMLLEYYLAIAEEWINRGVDGIICTDDLGGKLNPS
ncbi:MAG: hypothetical protein ACTSUE_12595 [Promethearchaeota archaeon]